MVKKICWSLSLTSLCLWLIACGTQRIQSPTTTSTPDPAQVGYVSTVEALRSPDVPELPFFDNPDPLQCGIPTQWTGDSQGWLTGEYEGKLVAPIIYLYDSHLRLKVTTQAPHGSEVKILLYQQNPVVDYYLVKIVDQEMPNEGWVPAPFLSREPIEPLRGHQ